MNACTTSTCISPLFSSCCQTLAGPDRPRGSVGVRVRVRVRVCSLIPLDDGDPRVLVGGGFGGRAKVIEVMVMVVVSIMMVL